MAPKTHYYGMAPKTHYYGLHWFAASPAFSFTIIAILAAVLAVTLVAIRKHEGILNVLGSGITAVRALVKGRAPA